MKKFTIILCLVTLSLSVFFNSFAETPKNNKQLNGTTAKFGIGTPWNELSIKDKEQYKERILILMLHPYIQEAVNKYYGEVKQYDNAEIVNIKPLKLNHQIQIKVSTFTGAHNPPYGLDTITLDLDGTKIKVTNFIHKNI